MLNIDSKDGLAFRREEFDLFSPLDTKNTPIIYTLEIHAIFLDCSNYWPKSSVTDYELVQDRLSETATDGRTIRRRSDSTSGSPGDLESRQHVASC